MKQEGNIFFTADWHFNHKKLCINLRPFNSVEKMNEVIINNWNAKVGIKDTVFVLGDVFWCGSKQARAILAKLNGTKILIKGNHDKGSKRFIDMGFSAVDNSYYFYREDLQVWLSHYPYYPKWYEYLYYLIRDFSFKELRHLTDRLKNKGHYLLHGHVHHRWKIRGKQINVGVDVWNYTPVSIEEIKELIKC